MTGAILLYDHTSREGVFCSKSDVKVRFLLLSTFGFCSLCSLNDPNDLSPENRMTQIKRCLKEMVYWKQRQLMVGAGPGQLLDAVKYWSLHLKDVSTPEKLRALLDK